MLAASRGDLAEVRRLIEANQEINASDAFGNTALIYAASGGFAEIVEFLLRNGADSRIKNKLGRTSLQSAESRKHARVVTILMGADLLPSIREGDIERIIELLDSGVDVNLRLIEGWTPLMVAALDDQIEVARLLLSRGADVRLQNAKGLTAETIAERKGHQRALQLLRSARTGIRPRIQVPHVEPDILDLDPSPPVPAPADESEVIN